MFAAIVAPVRSSFAQRGVRTVVTVAKANSAPATTTAAAASPTATAGMSTTATQSAPLKHTVDAYGRVTSMNRTYHSTSSWEVRDVASNAQPANFVSRSADEEKRRIARTRNAMDLL